MLMRHPHDNLVVMKVADDGAGFTFKLDGA
jgi:hypothetical protein